MVQKLIFLIQKIDIKALYDCKIISKAKNGVKLLGRVKKLIIGWTRFRF